MNHHELIAGIEAYCRYAEIAETTFGRRAVNDGKFVGRLRDGKRVTTATIARVQTFIADNKSAPAQTVTYDPRSPTAQKTESFKADRATPGHFRFYDNRQKYLLFVNTCSEKWAVADRVGQELGRLQVKPPALRVFDAGMGDGTVLTRVMRHMHKLYPTVPFYVVGKEISLEDIRLTLEKLPDRFNEHPAMVVTITNMFYSEAPALTPRTPEKKKNLNWHEVALNGNSAHEFEEQIANLESSIADGWQVRTSRKTGNPLYVRPSVITLYRRDNGILLNNIIPRPGDVLKDYDLIIASQPFRLRASLDLKVKRVLSPLARALAPGGRMLTIHSHGHDPGADIIQRVWPGENPFQHNRQILVQALKRELHDEGRKLNYTAAADKRALFRYVMHTLPTEIGSSIGTSTLMAAWNAAVYVSQIEEDRLEAAMTSSDYLDATGDVLRAHNGLWFNDESFVVSRRRHG
ncbi:MAG: hypothetical protein VYA17_13300 [Pseudomonadota bacterium]|nr:hypothetical protein [Pseudomonadota bacterium]